MGSDSFIPEVDIFRRKNRNWLSNRIRLLFNWEF